MASIIVVAILKDKLPREAAFMAGIFTLAALLWVTEAVPLFTTALLVISLEIILLANPGNWAGLGFGDSISPNYRTFLEPLADPVIILFLGGFVLARVCVKEGVDKALASSVLRFFGSQPRRLLLGLMGITAVFSMWMSNTATTAMMITLVAPIVDQLPSNEKFKKALFLSVPFAANIGGMGTPIGSPPNAVAVAFLKQANVDVGFIDWVMVAMPLMIIMLLIVWLLLYYIYRPGKNDYELTPTQHSIAGNRAWFVIIIFSLTAILWLSGGIHGLPSSVVALFPIVVFAVTGMLTRGDINSLEWHILILIAGGIALGVGMQVTHLDKILITEIPHQGGIIFLGFVAATLLLSTFMSNTAAANLVIPVAISFTQNTSTMFSPAQMGLNIALIASMAMSLPVSTPPNAIAYSSGAVKTKDFIISGAIIGILGLFFILFIEKYVVAFWIK